MTAAKSPLTIRPHMLPAVRLDLAENTVFSQVTSRKTWGPLVVADVDMLMIYHIPKEGISTKEPPGSGNLRNSGFGKTETGFVHILRETGDGNSSIDSDDNEDDLILSSKDRMYREEARESETECDRLCKLFTFHA
ncbi:hypothetical protein CEXT_761361 [Caerostris extrusa]|uniref:Uncharacterized protein n=1 Tax=Caerostris extrusa TaxID=172846 RepID=A0AAV4QFI8_CAEEX|nr:hypothetical protein CEXT_761361 [Caerostris extrusa]